MFEFRLLFIRLPDGRLVLRFSRILRGAFLAIAALLCAAMVASGSFSPVGAIFALASLAGGLLEERWIWHPGSRHLERRSGLLFPYRIRLYPAAEITGIELRRFTRGQQPGPLTAGAPKRKASLFAPRMVGLAIDVHSHGLLTVETHQLRSPDGLEEFARELARQSGAPLTEKDEA